MSDVSPSIGEIVDSNNQETAAVAATLAANNVVDSVPDTTVVVEDNPTVTDPEQALAFADDVRRIARETTDQAMVEWMALAEANQPKPPEIVVVPAPEPEPEPEPLVPDVAAPPEDEPPPKTHRYFQPLGRGGKRGGAA